MSGHEPTLVASLHHMQMVLILPRVIFGLIVSRAIELEAVPELWQRQGLAKSAPQIGFGTGQVSRFELARGDERCSLRFRRVSVRRRDAQSRNFQILQGCLRRKFSEIATLKSNST